MGKKLFLCFMALCSLFALSACGGDSPEPDNITLANSTNGNSLMADGDGDRLTVSFTTNKDWTATSGQSWCAVSPASGVSGTGKIQVNVDKNELAQQRTADITLTAGTASVSITVTQREGKLNSGAETEDMENKEW